ncbi:MAG: thioester reductase domain-containing protein, partial [Pseudonocardiaceae bacterium]
LSAALRLPRPPAARTLRCTPRRPIVVVPETSVPSALVAALVAALPGRTSVVAGPLVAPPSGTFPILVGHGEPGPDRHVVPVDDPEAVAELVDDALTSAWLNGVEVTWDEYSYGRGRRIPLPTYPFQRRRYWALDRLPPVSATPGCAVVPAPAAAKVAVAEGGDTVIADVTAVWRELFGVEEIGVDDEFGSLGGTSLLSVRMALEIQQRHGCLVNVHRAGGSRTTIRRIAEIVRGKLGGAERGSPDIDPIADGDGDLLDEDLKLGLGDPAPAPAPGTDFLLTGATGFLGTFLLHELLAATKGRVYCVVRAADEREGRARLRETSAKFALPEPDPQRVHLVLGDLHEIGRLCREYRDGELAARVGHVLHCAAKVVFTEPYRVLRRDNVLPMVELLRWMRENGIGDFSFVSTVAATAPALGAGGRILETRSQSLDPQQGGYGVSKWVGERLLERTESDGIRVRIFRPGFILASRTTGACNAKDLIWHILASGLAVGAHPLDDRAMPMAPVDGVSRAIAELAVSPGSVGRAYHLIDQRCYSLRQAFELLADAGLPTKPLPSDEWLDLVAKEALSSGNEVLSTMALYELEGHDLGEDGMEAVAWRPWLDAAGVESAPDGALLRAGLTYLSHGDTAVGRTLANLVREVV